MRSPLRFRPHLRPMVWGGRHLGDVLGKPLPTPAPYGEAWEISDHGSHHSVVTSGVHAGQTLRELLERHRLALLGESAATGFPWLIKYLDACDWLSVQVHPDEEAVRRLLPGEGSKTEAWFILATQPGARVYAGLLPGVGEPQLRQALDTGTVANCLHAFEPAPGDCLFLPAGTVHAVGGGVLIAEVQQTSDATFRLFDWNRRDSQGRSRTLHVDEALACIDWSAGPVTPIRASGYPHEGTTPGESVWQSLVRCRYFHLDYVRQSEPFALAGTGRMQAVLVLHGRGQVWGEAGLEELAPGDTVLLPAALPGTWLHPRGSLGLLVATLPVENLSHHARSA